ncbi:hypothetical protein [Achromobacter denitrificans]|uniref:hypothetical protein n=1 Tax=Achromobacter denitrificans TaxID=32002 RepID=UPI003CFCA94D
MGKGGNSGTQTTKSEPWKGVVPYLTGSGGTTTRTLRPGAVPISTTGGGWVYDGNGESTNKYWDPGTPQYADSDYITTTTGGIPGIYGEAARLYQEGGWTPEMQGVTDEWLAALQGRSGVDPKYAQSVLDMGSNLLSGEGSQLDLVKTRAAQGALDPTAALQQLLSGQVNNPYLDEQIAALGKDLSSNFLENVAPGMRSGAVAAGGFGGSRQGIVEGLGTQGVSDALATAGANLRVTAFENAQNRMQQIATGLNEQAATVGQNNINNKLNFANLGSNLIGQGSTMQTANQAAEDARYQQMLSLLGAGDAYNWGNLGNYASIIQPGAGVGGTTTASGPGGNPIMGAAGGGLAGYGVASMLGASTPWGIGIGAGLGLLGSL